MALLAAGGTALALVLIFVACEETRPPPLVPLICLDALERADELLDAEADAPRRRLSGQIVADYVRSRDECRTLPGNTS